MQIPFMPGSTGAACFRLALVLVLSLTGCDKPHTDSPGDAPVVDFKTTTTRAEAGNADAQNALGRVYAKGQGVEQSYARAAEWYRKAAEQGHAGAQAALGELYETGQGVPNDDAEAAGWYRRAAEQGHVTGQYSLAVLYVMGKGVPRDVAEAVRWYRRAAEKGNALAQYNLGMRYREGDGVPQDPVEGYAWLSLAASQELQDAINARDELKREMTRDQVSAARRRLKELAGKAN